MTSVTPSHRRPCPIKGKEVMEEAEVLAPGSSEEVHHLLLRCADYFELQDGERPDEHDAGDLFTSAPEGWTAADKLIFGLRKGPSLVALAELLLGYPRSCDCYLGLLVVDPQLRGRGLGASLLRNVESYVEKRGMERMLAAVLDTNAAGLRFWQASGFQITRSIGPSRFKRRMHSRVELAKRIGG